MEADNTFDILHDLFAKIFDLLECVVIDEPVLKFKGQVIFRQSVPKKNKHCGIKIFKSFVTWEGLHMWNEHLS